ncbi:MAG: NAD-dependent DNA ligase LigA [Mesonia hippocampi]|uniref:NAD-dependent DNA ligase LigA n=1 Tax=Mesonia hippocampi TaxID=1628250 RepID=UPI003F9AEFC4
MNIKEKIENLREELRTHNYNYYVLDKPIITDFEFDKKLEELQALETKHPEFFDANSPTQRVGGEVTKNFNTVTHEYRMYSLANSYSKEDLEDWEARLHKLIGNNITYTCELKYDGVSISIHYEKGLLVKAVTRGDGFQGDDVTANVKTIRSVPLKLKGDFPDKLEIRGEIILPYKGFTQLNQKRIAQGEEPYANPRNTASGSLKLQDSAEVAQRPLDCLLYGVVGEKLPFLSHYESLEKARQWGFKVPPQAQEVKDITEVLAYLAYWNERRHDLPYETDGVVVKVNNIQQQEELGYTAKAPRWAMAYKFKAEQAHTQLEHISFQVGRTGAITPVANLTPVQLAGTIVKRASLHNADQIEKLDVREGDWVFVEKGGEIIPKIVAVDFTKRAESLTEFTYITTCPECNTPLKREEGEAQHYCPNAKGCPPQIIGRIQHFISRKAMDVEGLGGETVALLVKEKLIESYADLYELKKEQLLPLERMAEKSADNLLQGIEASKNIPFERVLYALGIRHVGETVAKKLALHYKNITTLRNATKDDLVSVDEIGEKIADSIIEFFGNPTNIAFIERLKRYGLQFSIAKELLEGLTDKLSGSTFVISGVFTQVSRKEIKTLIEKNGGKVTSSISAKTDYLVAGENMGPSKLAKAEKLGTKMLSEEAFLALLD